MWTDMQVYLPFMPKQSRWGHTQMEKLGVRGTPSAIYRSAKDQEMPSEGEDKPSQPGQEKDGSRQGTRAKEAGTSMKTA